MDKIPQVVDIGAPMSLVLSGNAMVPYAFQDNRIITFLVTAANSNEIEISILEKELQQDHNNIPTMTLHTYYHFNFITNTLKQRSSESSITRQSGDQDIIDLTIIALGSSEPGKKRNWVKSYKKQQTGSKSGYLDLSPNADQSTAHTSLQTMQNIDPEKIKSSVLEAAGRIALYVQGIYFDE